MKWRFVHSYVLLGIIFSSNILCAQNIQTEEEINLKFQSYFFEALKQKAIKNNKKAIENLEKCYEIDATNLAVQFEISKNQLLLRNFFEAELFINKALLQAPKNSFLLEHKVAILKAQQNFLAAIKIQKELVQINSKFSDALVLLYIQNQNFTQAEKLVLEMEKKAIATTKTKGYKTFLENRKKLVEAVKLGDSLNNKSASIENLKKIYSKKKEYTILQEILNKEFSSKLFKMLYNDSKEGLELFPAQPFLYKMNGLALINLKKYNEAITVLTIGIDFVVDDIRLEASFYELLSKSYEGLNNKAEALKYKQKAESLRKEN